MTQENVFSLLTMLGGLCLFLFGMNVMGQALERSAGSKLEIMLRKYPEKTELNITFVNSFV